MPVLITYRFGPFRLLPDQRRLERDGAVVSMTPKAFDLLVALVRNRSRALSKDELLELVWSGASVEEGNLAQQVLLLRRALAEAGDCVATVPRHGYRFVAPVIEESDANHQPIDSLQRGDPEAPATQPGWRSASAAILVAAAIVFTVLGAAIRPWLWAAADDAVGPPTAFALALEANERSEGPPAISPDGRLVAYQSTPDDGVQRLRLRSLDTTDARELPGTEGGTEPFFSPDGTHLAFFANGKLKRMPIADGLPHDLCAVLAPRGGSWGEDGFIVFANGLNAGLFRVPAGGGTPEPFTTLAADERNHRYPHVLPGARSVLFTVTTTDYAFRVAGQASGASKHQLLVPDGLAAQFGADRLVYGSSRGEVFTAPFDPVSLRIIGSPAAAQERPGAPRVGHLALSVARNGAMVYVPRQTFARRLAIVERNGTVQPILEAPVREYDTPRLSPDGSQILVSIGEGLVETDVWVYDMRRRTLRRVTRNGYSRRGLWTPDGSGVTFDRWRDSPDGSLDNAFLLSATAEDDAAATQITHGNTLGYGTGGGWAGNDFLYTRVDPKTSGDIWMVTRGRPETARPLIVRDGVQRGRPSPDGRWLAIVSNETGADEVYLTTLPKPGALTRISAGGGTEPVWATSSDQLFFRRHGEIFSVRVSRMGAVEGSARSTGIKGFPQAGLIPTLSQYDVFADGRFLILQDEQPATVPKPTVVLNWARAPAK